MERLDKREFDPLSPACLNNKFTHFILKSITAKMKIRENTF